MNQQNQRDHGKDEQDDRNVSFAEAGPSFRAMAMVAQQPPVLMHAAPDEIQKQHRPFVVAVDEKQHHVQQPTAAFKQPPNVPRCWTNPTLTRLGPYYQLEKNHQRFEATKLQELLRMTEAALVNLSMQTHYSEQPIAVDCISLDQVHFRVCFWQPRDDDDSAVVVEVQRRSGDCANFCRYAREILCALRNETPPAPPQPVPPALMERLELVMEQEEPNELDTALEISLNLVEKDRYDAKQLGLESVCILTNPTKTLPSTAVEASKVLVTGSSFERLHEHVFSLAVTGRCAYSSDAFGGQHAYLALVAVANALQVLAERNVDSLTCLEESVYRLTGVDLVAWLLERVHLAAAEPHVAYHALLALSALCQLPNVAKRVREQLPVIEQAQHIGHQYHAALEQASSRLLVALHA